MTKQTIKVVGGYKQPIAKLPENEQRIGGSVSGKYLNPEVKKRVAIIAAKIEKKGGNK